MKVSKPQISVVIPVYNEEKNISRILKHLIENSSPNHIKEIIVVDGGSTDNTVNLALLNNRATVIHSNKGRAKQLNFGAQRATSEIIYFLHADTFPPKNFDESIINTVAQGNKVGCFEMRFDSDSKFLNFFALLTKINHTICRGGDQSLFITKDFFIEMNGFNESYIIYEDNEFIARTYKATKFTILPDHVKTSARKHRNHGNVKLQYHFGVIHLKNILGAGPDELHDYYKRNIAIQ
ncbi:TIGR04283 family arsenosugar biosynthesis glycosyltransferase [Cellulophaga baltica]|uniref:TIGR04283 family arsenosugar biosynthesis glycosyltransferase n=1 Tax=Cellulophaga TaxID=104264 RepID=UPI001C06DCF2|nr:MULTISPECIES: TIGR04283 family arsenosugar biosynthesis glycosyltransferase [Cellulophaga]MBU2995481.1 TIGR04283 family arsenosugar biosynthesis glycosyltransferase [Cellulophaga baltica]MDO6766875.1 TIGR04283 family arsenosugar biosynthesis glycosyltransferase [Cellulophaga sp. 1_MG-2023]